MNDLSILLKMMMTAKLKKRSASLNSKPSSLRRVTIASLPRNIGTAGMVTGMENNDRFSRRSSSWCTLGSKQSEHCPSLPRLISTYSWADAEEEKCELKTKDDSEPPGEEIVERTRKPSLSEKKNHPSRRDVSSVYDTMASWATHLKSSIRKADKAIWLSIAFIVMFAALVSLLTDRFFQKSVDATPTQEEDSWMSLEHILWSFTRLQHNGPPPVQVHRVSRCGEHRESIYPEVVDSCLVVLKLLQQEASDAEEEQVWPTGKDNRISITGSYPFRVPQMRQCKCVDVTCNVTNHQEWAILSEMGFHAITVLAWGERPEDPCPDNSTL
ncbi:Inositol 1,4,5-triphosphate receptor associated 2 [Saguinus oedipus]|uniref:Inositol 1,4,5-triphosphate receptor associated 2 n=1 Tax=Saguinus oedipus TaxID=9490 RepID=A0ABQ9U6Z8_SAGOE|nr:Inositol 1,4,5-triphosphate receptor associated 2 [Saguinus oedipus]